MRPKSRPGRPAPLHRRRTGPDPTMGFVLLRRPQKTELPGITRGKIAIVPTNLVPISLVLRLTRARRKILSNPAHRLKSRAPPRKSTSKDSRPQTSDFGLQTSDFGPRTSRPNPTDFRPSRQRSEVRGLKSEVRRPNFDVLQRFPCKPHWRRRSKREADCLRRGGRDGSKPAVQVLPATPEEIFSATIFALLIGGNIR